MLVKRCFTSVMSTTCILQHAVVCWVTAAGIRAIALTLGWKPSKGIEHVGIWGNGKEFAGSMMNIHLGIFLSSFRVIILYYDALSTNIYLCEQCSWLKGTRMERFG